MTGFKPFHLAILEEFDAGEQDLAKLAAAHDYSVEGIRSLLKRAERKLPSRSDAKKAALADPAVRKRMSDAKKAAWADPAVRKRMSDAKKAALADPAVRKRMSDATKAAWADPAVRKRMSDAKKAALADPAVRRRISEALRARRFVCPKEFRPLYSKIRQVVGAKAAQREVRRALAEAIAQSAAIAGDQVNEAAA